MGSRRYDRIHARLKVIRGRASRYPCAAEGCTRRAHDWAWDHTGPTVTDEFLAFGSIRAISYGLDPTCYRPLCRAHHVSFDMRADPDYYPCGHPRAGNTYTRPGSPEGLNGYCRTCHREESRARAAAGKRPPRRVERARAAERAHLASGGSALFELE